MKQQIDNARGGRSIAAQELRQNLVKLLANALDAEALANRGLRTEGRMAPFCQRQVLQRKCRSG